MPASAPPLSPLELEVARGSLESSVRTAGEGRLEYRVVSVQAGFGQALVVAQLLEPTQQVLTRLGVALPLVGGAGMVLAALAGMAVAPGRVASRAAVDLGDRAGGGHR